MIEPKVGLITIGDPREHEWNNVFKHLATDRHEKAVELFKKLPIQLYSLDRLPRDIESIKEQVKTLKSEGVEVFVLHIACWTWPNLATIAVQEMNLPTVLFANRETGTHATVGLLGAGGALNQIGFNHIRIQENYEDSQIIKKLEKKFMPMAKAACTINQLRGSVFGLFGGRSLGIDTGTYDPMQWKKLFGIDSEHIDQLEIVRRTEYIEEARVDKMLGWLVDNVKSITYSEKFTVERFKFQIRCYLATKDIIQEKKIDFASIKCMPDLTNNYTPQCLSAAFLPTPFDAEGDKVPTTFSCEADADAALTMEMLKHVSGGMATMFADVSHLSPEDNLIYLPNCGAYSAWFAGRKASARENLQSIELREANRPAGGAITLFVAAPGPVTLARLSRTDGQYHMYLIKGEMITPLETRHQEFSKSRGKHQLPMSYIKVAMDFEYFVDTFNSNHIAGVGMDCIEEIKQVCRLLDIPVTILGE